MMKKVFFVLFVLAVTASILLCHAPALRALESELGNESATFEQPALEQEYAQAEAASFEQTASLTEPAPIEAPAVEVSRMAICTDVVNREPVEEGEHFQVSVGRLYAFTQILGAKDSVEIEHIWYFNDVERARVTLPVRSANWRTYSSKMIQLFEIGDWRVDVVDPQGDVLKSMSFQVIK
jgi:hypothetical protein